MTVRGIPESRLAAIKAPAGPNIGAVTPNEIALAAIAGLVALRRGHTDAAKQTSASGADTPDGSGKAPSASGKATPTADKSTHATGYINPVCGAVVDPARALSTLTMGGQTHYFCCQGCRVEFERDPEKYLAIGAHMRAPTAIA